MKIISNSVKDTLSTGKAIARNLKKGDIICLFGQLGSGKTVLTKGIGLGLGINKKRIISPSFVLIRQHTGTKLLFYHIDLYRLRAARDILALGYQEYLYGDGITVIEWADRLKYFLPEEYLKIVLSIRNNNKRLFEITALGKRYKELLDEIQKKV